MWATHQYSMAIQAYKVRRRLEWIAKNGPCVECGTWENLEVDHIDPYSKGVKITSLIWQISDKAERDAELSKCQVLCTFCHKTKTARDKEVLVEHGTLHMYNSPKYKCRCDACKMAWSNYLMNYRRGKRMYKPRST